MEYINSNARLLDFVQVFVLFANKILFECNLEMVISEVQQIHPSCFIRVQSLIMQIIENYFADVFETLEKLISKHDLNKISENLEKISLENKIIDSLSFTCDKISIKNMLEGSLVYQNINTMLTEEIKELENMFTVIENKNKILENEEKIIENALILTKNRIKHNL